MKRILIPFALVAMTSMSFADFAVDRFTDPPDVLLRIIESAQKNEPHSAFGSTGFAKNDMTDALQRAEYIGPLVAPFGTVYVAKLFFVRSLRKGASVGSPRGSTIIVFCDSKFRIRYEWDMDDPNLQFHVDGNKLYLADTLLFDYDHLPKKDVINIAVDGQVEVVPQWK